MLASARPRHLYSGQAKGQLLKSFAPQSPMSRNDKRDLKRLEREGKRRVTIGLPEGGEDRGETKGRERSETNSVVHWGWGKGTMVGVATGRPRDDRRIPSRSDAKIEMMLYPSRVRTCYHTLDTCSVHSRSKAKIAVCRSGLTKLMSPLNVKNPLRDKTHGEVGEEDEGQEGERREKVRSSSFSSLSEEEEGGRSEGGRRRR
ncbi:hypothetical protein CBR_g37910 [Chara braunii]|uniref:Uncharacterized protein n=1 Tax=Chara braunii TaxID=69332 RepID=A0A388LP92_CHABU|nr:hypothetical protein CBR_g37910 [Chara braunii]|eukprot:GBG84033.1 hypothetical protein CBR_g37910 [Chara braunii]